MLSIEPKKIQIQFDAIEQSYSGSFTICNISSQKTRLSIQSEASKFISSPLKRGNFYSGESQVVTISYVPSSWGLETGMVHITCAGTTERFSVEIIAFPHPNISLPKHLNFGSVQVSKRKTVFLTLDNPLGLDIDFHVDVTNEQPDDSFMVVPKHGQMKMSSSVQIAVTFKPLALCHGSMVIHVRLDLYGFEPVSTLVSGAGRIDSQSQ
jgi:hypothetical protein